MKMDKALLITVVVLILVSIYPSTASVPVAQFRGTPTTGPAPLSLTFADQSTGNPNGWVWYFGDENYTAPWTPVNTSPGWLKRSSHSSVVMPDGSIVLMGGYTSGGPVNDTWRSTDNGATWMQVNASPGWIARSSHSSVVMPDGSIVLMGGYDANYTTKNDVWRSTDNGASWMQVNASPGWIARSSHSSVVMPDGSILLIGGVFESPASMNYLNDVWRSTDYGTTWTQVTASADWEERYGHSCVVMPDGSIVLMGGATWLNYKNDVWRSTNNGTTWTQIDTYPGWSGRAGASSVAMPDGSIVLMGGFNESSTSKNDVWRSTDYGATWTLVNASPGWRERHHHTSVAMPDGSIVLMGGMGIDGGSADLKNDVWRFQPSGSSAQNPSHTYTSPGTYQVALQVSNAGGNNSTRKVGYITVTPAAAPAKTGVYRPGVGFYLKMENGSTWTPSNDRYLTWDNYVIDLPIAGDWNADGHTETGVYRPGVGFFLKMDTGGPWTPSNDRYLAWDNAALDLPVAGDWNGDGRTETGVYRPGVGFYLKMDNGSAWTPSNDRYLAWDNYVIDLPIAGDWNGDGRTETGVYRPGVGFFLKMDNGSTWTPSNDRYLAWDNAAKDLPISWCTHGNPLANAGEWNWTVDGWTGWSHNASWSGSGIGQEYGPLLVDMHGDHGTYINLNAGTTSAEVNRTFIDPTETGWNSLIFKGSLTASDIPSGRWMTIDVNGQRVFSGNASSSPPGNGQDFEIQCTFPRSSRINIKISHGQNPAWREYFVMRYYSLTLTQ